MLAILTVALLLLQHMAVYAADIDDYVWKTDENYGWVYMGAEHDIHGTDLNGEHSYTGYVLNMTSQRWLTDADFAPESDAKSIWWHYLVVIVPEEIKHTSNATIWITGGSQTSGVPKAEDEDVLLPAALAMGMGVVTGSLFQVPNEHTIFAADPLQKSRTEDSIIAYTWDHFLNDPSQPEWLLRFPMVKASVRAMDAMTEFMTTQLPLKECTLESFIVAGASKRGWTTWMVGAVDSVRVKAIIPIVLDAINFAAVEHHEWTSYGGWGWALIDYYEMGIMNRLDDPNMLLMQQQIDPFFFKERLTMPKLVVNAGLDEFQHPDDTHYWWNEMPEPKHFIMTPNAEHSEITGILEIVPAIGTWGAYLLQQHTVPVFTWDISNITGEITATLDDEGDVYEASMWYANSCGTNADGIKRRDFRILNMDSPCHCGIAAAGYCANLKSFWTRVVLEAEVVDGKRVYRAERDAPEDGRYTAFFIDIKYKELELSSSFMSAEYKHKDAVFEGGRLKYTPNNFLPVDKPGRLEFTTEVSIWPNTFPYPECEGDGCTGYLV